MALDAYGAARMHLRTETQVLKLAAGDIRTNASARPVGLSNVDAFSNCERIFHLDAEVTHRAVKLGVTKQQLNSANVAGLTVDQRRLGASK